MSHNTKLGTHMKTINHPLFGETFEPESFLEMIDLITSFNTISEHGTPRNIRMWRGQADLDWPIHSSAFRRLKLENKSVTEEIMQSYEKDLIKEARHRGHDYLDHKVLNDLEVLARLQHFGAATRLIDASRNALIALYFAVSSAPNHFGLLLGVHSWHCGGGEGAGFFTGYEEAVKGLAEYEHAQTWEPSVVTPRIAAQHSQFLYSAVSSSPIGSLGLPVKIPGAVAFIAISPNLKQITIDLLRHSFDIHLKTLFPDVEGFSAANSYKISSKDMHRW